MVDPAIVAFLAVFAEDPNDIPATFTILEQYNIADPRRSINLFHEQSIVCDPSHFDDQALIQRHLAVP